MELQSTHAYIARRDVVDGRACGLEDAHRATRVGDLDPIHDDADPFPHGLDPRRSRVIPDGLLSWAGSDPFDRRCGHSSMMRQSPGTRPTGSLMHISGPAAPNTSVMRFGRIDAVSTRLQRTWFPVDVRSTLASVDGVDGRSS